MSSLWDAFTERFPEHAGPPPTADCFGDSPQMADALLELVLDGRKRATAGLAAELVPSVGDHWIINDGAGHEAAIIRTTDVRVGPLGSVDDDFAWDEGEGDRSRADWLRGHREYFRRNELPGACDAEVDALEVAFERFEVVWPPGVQTQFVRSDDPELLTALEREASEAALGHLFDIVYPSEQVALRWAIRMADETVTVMVVLDPEPAGYAAFDDTTLLHFGVVPERFGDGLASRLLAEVRRIRPTVSSLSVLEENTRARRFYERHGWRPDGRRGTSEFPPYPADLGYSLRL